MKNTFKKTLVATAVLAFAGVANAATLTAGGNAATSTATALEASAEGVADVGLIRIGTAATDNFDIKLTNQVTNVEQDVLEITFSGATIVTTGANASVPVMTGYEFFDVPSPSTIRFRVRSGGVAANTVTDLTGVRLVPVAGATRVTMSTRVLSLNPVIGEYDRSSGRILDILPQLEVAVDNRFDAVISTENNRKFFNASLSTGVGSTATADVVTLSLTNNSGYEFSLPVTDAVNAVVTHTLRGDFSYLRDADKAAFSGNANGSLSSAEIAAKVVPVATDDTFTFALSSDNSTLTVTQTAVGSLDSTVQLTFNTFAAPTSTAAVLAAASGINASNFTATIAAKTDDADFSVANNVDVGAWRLDGSVVRVPYMVIQTGRFSSIMNVTNHGVKSGEILIDVFGENGEVIASGVNAGTSEPGSIVSVANAARNALIAAGKDLSQLVKFSVQITTNVPEDDIIVYAAYADSQNGGERAIVNNDSKVQTK